MHTTIPTIHKNTLRAFKAAYLEFDSCGDWSNQSVTVYWKSNGIEQFRTFTSQKEAMLAWRGEVNKVEHGVD